MSLMINQNITALNAWRNLGKTDREMSGVMEKLSSGLRINKAADDPAGLVISEQMRAQVVGLHAAIKNSEKGVSMIQTAEAALDKVHSLLDKMRGLALDSANNATNDANMLAANQAEIDNIIATITRISDTTQYGTKKLLNGDNAITGAITAAGTGARGVSGITFGAGQTPTSLAVNVTAVPAANTFAPGTTGAALVAQGTLAVGSYTLTVDGRFEQFGAVDVTGLTNVGSAAISAASYTGAVSQTVSLTVDGTDVNLLNVSLDGGATTLGTIDTTGHTTDGTDNAYAFTDAGTGLTFTATLQFGGAMTAGQSTTMAVTASTATVAFDGTTQSLSSQTANLATYAIGGAQFDLSGVDYANGVAADTASVTVTAVAGFTAALGTGPAVGVTANSTVALTDANGSQANVAFGATVAAGTATIDNFVDNSLVFQIGANQNQTVRIAIRDVDAAQLAIGVANTSGFTSLADVNITDAVKATDSIGLIDRAIDQISVIRGNLGAFQANTLEANLDSLRVAAENLQASESIIRDADMAAEMAQFTKYQIMMQAGTAMLAQANQVPQNLLRLLQG